MASSVTPGKVKEKGKAPITVDSTLDINVHSPTNLTNLLPVPTLKPPSGGSASKIRNRKGGCVAPKFDPTAMFNKLAAAKENGKKKKELTLVGFLVGGQKEYPIVFVKLRMEWKPLKGTLSFNPLKSGWFEVSFSNQSDFQMIWNNRPYHLFSQLLLIKQWYPGFDPTNESISTLDLWVRLHYLPEEFANKDALETIIEGNFVGKFIRMDPSHNSDRWNLFTRFCINTDVERTLGKGVIVPDEHFNQIKYSLWFDDFSPGFGACGKIAHTFRDCSRKNSPIPTLQLTIKKPSSKKPQLDSTLLPSLVSEGWNLIGKNNKAINPSKLVIPNNNIYLTERGGISVTFESDDSEEGVQHLLESEEITLGGPNLISAAADLHPYNLIMEGKTDIATAKNQGHSSKEQPMVTQISEGQQSTGNLNIKELNKDKDNNWQNLPISVGSTTMSGNILSNSASNLGNEALDKVENYQKTDFSNNKENSIHNKLSCEATPSFDLQSDSKEQQIFPNLPPTKVCNENQQQYPLEEEM